VAPELDPPRRLTPASRAAPQQAAWRCRGMPPLAYEPTQTLHPQRFGSGDSCGDWIVEWGPDGWFQLQAVNTLSSLCYLVAGLQIIACAETQLARAYGLVNCFVALGAVGLHATSTVAGFIGDIVSIAATMVLLLNGAVRAALAASERCSPALVGTSAWLGCAAASHSRWRRSTSGTDAIGRQLITRTHAQEFSIPICVAFFTVYITTAMILAGFPHTDVWAVWAGFSGLVALCSMVAATVIFFDEALPMAASGWSSSLLLPRL